MKILIVTPFLPYPGVAHGGGTAMLNNILCLRRHHEIFLAAMYEADEKDKLGAIAEYATLVIATETVTDTQANAAAEVRRVAYASWPTLLGLILRSLSGWILRGFFNCDYRRKPAPETSSFLRQVLAKIDEIKPDLVQVEYTQMAVHLGKSLKQKRIPSVAVAMDVEMKQLYRRFQSEPWGLRKLLAYVRYQSRRQVELKAYSHFQRVYTLSQHDQEILNREAKSLPVSVRRHVMHLPPPSGPVMRCPNMVLFVGAMVRHENIEAMKFILDQVWWKVKTECPSAELHVVGGGVTDEICQHHNGKDIFVHGYVPDLPGFYLQSRVMLAPLFTGGGIIIKVFEALAYGLPTVATPIANEGVAATPGKEILLATTADEFARQITRLLRDDDLWQTLSTAGQQLIRTVYQPDHIAATLEREYETIIREFKLQS